MKALKKPIILRPSPDFHQREGPTILKICGKQPPGMTLLGPQYLKNDLLDLPESDLDIPDDPILDIVNSQCHSSEDLGPGSFRAYQVYQVTMPLRIPP